MYVPPHFREDRLPVLHEAIRRGGLATLVTVGPAGPLASHIPMLLDSEPAPYGTLLGHVARANPQWSEPAVPGLLALAIFLGPDSYVSPSWYPTKQQTGKVVPTWNYVAVHASGPIQFFDEPERLRALVTRLTELHEADFPQPWRVADAPAEFIAGQLKGIVGLELRIERLDGKWKLSQNRPEQDRRGAMAGLAASGRPDAIAVAAEMARLDAEQRA
jgi:transcriptional regulator